MTAAAFTPLTSRRFGRRSTGQNIPTFGPELAELSLPVAVTDRIIPITPGPSCQACPSKCHDSSTWITTLAFSRGSWFPRLARFGDLR